MNGFSEIFIIPLAVVVFGSLIVYWTKLLRQQTTVRHALINEINMLLRQCGDFKEYLIQDGHDWLKEGMVLDESPVFIRSSYKVYKEALSQLYLLSKEEITKVLMFYNHHEECQTLLEILFARIHQQEESKKQLTDKQIAITKARVERIIDGLTSVLKIRGGQIVSLYVLPEKYGLPTAKETAIKMGHVFKKAELKSEGMKEGPC